MSSGHTSRVRKLYKLILRLHRNLPDDLRVLGDLYAKEEFKRHKICKPVEARTFLSEWQDYAATMLRQAAPARMQRPGNRQAAPEEHPGNGKAAPAQLPGNGQVGTEGPAARARHHLTFGRHLEADAYEFISPDQMFNLYMLLVNAGGNRNHEPIDIGIDISETDTFAVKATEAKNYIAHLERIRKERVARGDLGEDSNFNADAWMLLLDIAVDDKDKDDALAQEMIKEIKVNREKTKIKNPNGEADK